jgi:hypothetical protein
MDVRATTVMVCKNYHQRPSTASANRRPTHAQNRFRHSCHQASLGAERKAFAVTLFEKPPPFLESLASSMAWCWAGAPSRVDDYRDDFRGHGTPARRPQHALVHAPKNRSAPVVSADSHSRQLCAERERSNQRPSIRRHARIVGRRLDVR